MLISISGNDLTIEQLIAVASDCARVELTDDARARIRAARKVVDETAARGDLVYGMNTELGPLSKRRVADDEMEQFQLRTIVGHTVAFFTDLDTPIVRAMMLARVNGFAKGGAGVRLEIAEKLIELLNKQVHPLVVCGSSVGQADLSEMSQIAQVLVGLGKAEYKGQRMSGAEALEAASIAPVRLATKEALALISSNGFTVGGGSLILEDARRTMLAFDLAAALALEAFGGNISIINASAAKLKAHPGHKNVSKRLHKLLAGSYLWEPNAARNLQDPLSFRCVPQVHGALDEAVNRLKESLEIELNSAGDNPLVSVDDRTIISVGNFDITNLSIGFDTLRLALTHAVNLSNQRIQKQLWSHFSELPTGLERSNDPLSRLFPLARTAAALTAEAQALSVPVSLAFRAQVSEGIEDHASAGPLCVQQTERLVQVAQRVIALELLISTAAIDLRNPPRLADETRRAIDFIKSEPWLHPEDWMPTISRILFGIKTASLANLSDPNSSVYFSLPSAPKNGSDPASAAQDALAPKTNCSDAASDTAACAAQSKRVEESE